MQQNQPNLKDANIEMETKPEDVLAKSTVLKLLTSTKGNPHE